MPHSVALVALRDTVESWIGPSQAGRVAPERGRARDLAEAQHQRAGSLFRHPLVQIPAARQVEDHGRSGGVKVPAARRDHLFPLPDRQHAALAGALAPQPIVDRPSHADWPAVARDQGRTPVARPQHETKKPKPSQLRLDADRAGLTACAGGAYRDRESEVRGRTGASDAGPRQDYKSTRRGMWLVVGLYSLS